MLNTRRNSVNCLLPNLLRWKSFNKNLLSASDIFMITKCEQNSRDGLHGLKKCYVAIKVDAECSRENSQSVEKISWITVVLIVFFSHPFFLPQIKQFLHNCYGNM